MLFRQLAPRGVSRTDFFGAFSARVSTKATTFWLWLSLLGECDQTLVVTISGRSAPTSDSYGSRDLRFVQDQVFRFSSGSDFRTRLAPNQNTTPKTRTAVEHVPLPTAGHGMKDVQSVPTCSAGLSFTLL